MASKPETELASFRNATATRFRVRSGPEGAAARRAITPPGSLGCAHRPDAGSSRDRPDVRRGARACPAHRRVRVPRRSRSHRRRGGGRVGPRRPVRLPGAWCEHVRRDQAGPAAPGGAQRPGPGSADPGREPAAAPRVAGRQRAAGRGGHAVLPDRGGPAPLHRRRRRRDVPRRARRAGRRTAGIRGLRSAGYESGHHHDGQGTRALDRRRQRPGPAATPPMSTYLFTVVAGPFHSIRADHRGLPFGLHARQSLAGHLRRDAEEIFAITRACFDRYSEIFAEPYPYDYYDQAFVPELEAGAMENPGCVTFRDEFLFPSAVTRAERQTRGVVIAHEMAHMWFGDLVTMRWWDDVWLSESFAEYMGFQVLSEATAFTGTWTDFALARKPRGYDADQRPSTHPVAPGPRDVPDADAALSNYDDISYAKGASALRQLVAWIGWPAFLAGINDYLSRHRFGNAALADLLDCLTRASGTDVHDWAGHWLRSAGVDTLAVSRETAGDGAASISHLGSRPHRVSVGVYDHGPGEEGQLTLRARFAVSVEAAAGKPALPPGALRPWPALVLPNDGDLSYCKIRFDPQSWATVTSSLGGIGDPLSRAVIWHAARDLVRDGELPAREYLGLAARHLPAETDTRSEERRVGKE